MNQTKVGGFGANVSKVLATQQQMGKTGGFLKSHQNAYNQYDTTRDGPLNNSRIGTTSSDITQIFNNMQRKTPNANIKQ